MTTYAQSLLCCHLSYRGNLPSPLFCWHNKTPLSKTKFVNNGRLALLRANLPADKYTSYSFKLAQPPQQRQLELRTQPFKLWAAGKVPPTYCTLSWTLVTWHLYHPPCLNVQSEFIAESAVNNPILI